jgi:hypothetical protein
MSQLAPIATLFRATLRREVVMPDRTEDARHRRIDAPARRRRV